MPFRHGNTHRALGCLVALLILLPSVLSAQQETKEAKPPVIEGDRAAKETPPPKNEAAEAAAEQKPAAAKPLPPAPPVENKRHTEPTCDPRCQAAEKREKADLKAQQSMATAAEDLVVITWWQFWLGVAGIILLTGTLIYTRKASIFARIAANAAKDAVAEAKTATKAAEDAVVVTRDMGMAQTRAYVTITKIQARIGDRGIDVRTSFKNTENTPTKNLRISAAAAHRTGVKFRIPKKMNASKKFPKDIASTEDITLDHGILIDIDKSERDNIKKGVCTLFVDIRIQFEDVFDQTIDETLRYWRSAGPGTTLGAYNPLSPRLPADPEK